MKQLGMDFARDVTIPTKKAGHVRATSVEAAHEGKASFDARAREVLGYLFLSEQDRDAPPTSGELYVFAAHQMQALSRLDFTGGLLFVRRGLSDCKSAGLVEVVPNGQRRCAITKRTCETWRTRSR